MESDLKDVLVQTRELLKNPDSWIQGSLARNLKNIERKPYDSDACRFCITGAMLKVCGGALIQYGKVMAVLRKEINNSVIGSVEEFNDTHTHTHQEVLALLDKVINVS